MSGWYSNKGRRDLSRVARRQRNVCITVSPKVGPYVAPILSTIPVQLLTYHTTVIKGTDVGQPRNLAKAVTVE